MNSVQRAYEIAACGDLHDLVEAVEPGSEIALTRDGKVVARLIRDDADRDDEAARVAIDRIMDIGSRLTLGPELSIRALIDEGRKY